MIEANLSFEEYRAIPLLNASTLKLIEQAESLEHFEILKAEQESKPQSDWFKLGQAIHRVILEPHLPQPVALPDVDLRTNAGKATKQAFLDTLTPDQPTLPAQDYLRLESIIRRFDALSINTSLWMTEVTVTDDTFKGRLDAYDPSRNTIIDIKTTSAPITQFEASMTKYRYHLQAGLYHALANSNGLPSQHFKFIVLQTVPPYATAIFHLDPMYLVSGYSEALELHRKLKELPPTLHGTTQTISFTPNWFREP